MNRNQLIALVVAIPVVIGIALFVGGRNDGTPAGNGNITSGVTDDRVDAPDYDYLIPAGTGTRLDAGERVEIIPGELEVRVGEVIRIVNEDERGHVIGAFYVAAGETLTQTFSSPGVLAGECSVHPSGSFVLTVLA